MQTFSTGFNAPLEFGKPIKLHTPQFSSAFGTHMCYEVKRGLF